MGARGGGVAVGGGDGADCLAVFKDLEGFLEGAGVDLAEA